jgi:hypothetical protein
VTDDAAVLRRRADLYTPMAVRVAATLRIAEHIARGLATVPQLAPAIDVDPGALERLLRHLVRAGVIVLEEAGRYGLTPVGEALRDERVRAVLDVEGPLGRGDLAVTQLLHSVRTGEAAFPVVYGREFWDDLAADPPRQAAYDAVMGDDVAAWAPAIVDAYDWASLGWVVDVGGGNGTLMAHLLTAAPGLRGTVLDQPATAEAARAVLAEADVAERGDVVGGSFFNPLPTGADAYLLVAVLHDWDDSRARSILQRCADAAGANGRVVVVEKTAAGGAAVRTDMDLRMLVYFGGRERTVADLESLAATAGLRTSSVTQSGDLSILELRA